MSAIEHRNTKEKMLSAAVDLMLYKECPIFELDGVIEVREIMEI
jgi:hypothetical protein